MASPIDELEHPCTTPFAPPSSVAARSAKSTRRHCANCPNRNSSPSATTAPTAQAFAARFGARPFTDLATLLKEARPQAILVATPHPLHAAPVIEAAQAGVSALVEKPLAASLADCDAMLAAAKRAGTKLGVVSQRRFYEAVKRMKDAIDAGKIGVPILGVFNMFSWRDQAYYQSDPWRGKWDTEGGGVLINQSPHHLDLLQWFMGEIDEITGYWANLNHPYVEVEDTALAMIRFKNGSLASIVTTLSHLPRHPRQGSHPWLKRGVNRRRDRSRRHLHRRRFRDRRPAAQRSLDHPRRGRRCCPISRPRTAPVSAPSTPRRIITPCRFRIFCKRCATIVRRW